MLGVMTYLSTAYYKDRLLLDLPCQDQTASGLYWGKRLCHLDSSKQEEQEAKDVRHSNLMRKGAGDVRRSQRQLS